LRQFTQQTTSRESGSDSLRKVRIGQDNKRHCRQCSIDSIRLPIGDSSRLCHTQLYFTANMAAYTRNYIS